MAIARGGLRDRRTRAGLVYGEIQEASLLGTLLGKDVFQGAPGQAIDYDWTQQGVPLAGTVTPRRASRVAVFSYEEIQPASVIETLLSKDTIYGAFGQVGDYDWTQQGVPLVNVVMPRRTYGVAARSYEEIQPANPTETLLGQDRMLGAPGQAIDYDWTEFGVQVASTVRPPRAARPAYLSYEEIQPASLLGTLLGTDAVYGAPGQAADYEWVVPRGPVRIRVPTSPDLDPSAALFTPPATSTMYGAAGEVPTYDWQLPRGRRVHASNQAVRWPSTLPDAEARLSGWSVAQTNTTATNDLSADGLWWAQARDNIVVDKFGKIIALLQRYNSNTQAILFTVSNDGGATWSDPTRTNFHIAAGEDLIIRGAMAYDPTNDLIHVGYVLTQANGAVIYRQYTLQRDGSNNITGVTRTQSGQMEVGVGGMAYESPAMVWIPEGGARGTVVFAWTATNPAASTTKAEVRATMRRVSATAADADYTTWIPPLSAGGAGDTDTLGTAWPTGTALKYSCLAKSANGAQPWTSVVRKSSGAPTRANDLLVTTVMAGNSLYYNRAGWASATNDWSGGLASALANDAGLRTIGTILRAGTDTGYSLKYQLLTSIAESTGGDLLMVGLPTWKSNADGDTWTVWTIDGADTVSSPVDLYSAKGAHSYAPTGDVIYDVDADLFVVTYCRTATQAACVQTMRGTTPIQGETVMFDTQPVDIPTMYHGRIGGKLAYFIRDTVNTPNPPYHGWFGTMTWSLAPRPVVPVVLVDAWPPTPATRARVATRTQSDAPVSLLGTLLLPPTVTAPTTSLDMTQAVRAVSRAPALREVFSSLSSATLAGQDVLYGAPGQVCAPDLLLPNRPAGLRAIVNRTALLGLVLGPLDWQDLVYGDPGEVPAYDWQRPVVSRSPRAASTLTDPGWVDSMPATSASLYVNAVRADSPGGYWRLDEISGTVAVDWSGHGYDGAYVASPALGQPGALFTESDAAVLLDGISQYVNVAPSVALGGASLTLEVWAKSATSTWSENGFLLSTRAANGFILHPNVGARTVDFFVFDSGNTIHQLGQIAPADVTAWHHYAATYDNATGAWAVYLDGVSVSTGTGTAGWRGNANVTLTIGRDQGLARFGNATLDEAAVYGTALPAARVLAHYQAGIGAPIGALSVMQIPTGPDQRRARLGLTNQVGVPFGLSVPMPSLNYDWPLSPGYRRVRQDLVVVPPVGSNAVYGALGQAPPYEWVVPPGYRRAIDIRAPIPLWPRVLVAPPPAAHVFLATTRGLALVAFPRLGLLYGLDDDAAARLLALPPDDAGVSFAATSRGLVFTAVVR